MSDTAQSDLGPIMAMRHTTKAGLGIPSSSAEGPIADPMRNTGSEQSDLGPMMAAMGHTLNVEDAFRILRDREAFTKKGNGQNKRSR